MARWRRLEPALGEFADLDALRTAVHDRKNLELGDQILAALARLAAVTGHADQLAARVVLQLLVPGAVRLGRSLAAMVGDPVASEAAVFAELAIGIRTYPWQRRPHRIAANLLLDCRQRITRHSRRTFPETPAGLAPGDLPTAAAGDEHGWQEVIDLLQWARRTQVLTPLEAGLLLTNHVLEIPTTELVGVFSRSRSTLFNIRTRAEYKLRRALTAEATNGYQADRRPTGTPGPRSAPTPDPAPGLARVRNAGRRTTGRPATVTRTPAPPATGPSASARPGSLP